jgi:hypothetical protein
LIRKDASRTPRQHSRFHASRPKARFPPVRNLDPGISLPLPLDRRERRRRMRRMPPDTTMRRRIAEPGRHGPAALSGGRRRSSDRDRAAISRLLNSMLNTRDVE